MSQNVLAETPSTWLYDTSMDNPGQGFNTFTGRPGAPGVVTVLAGPGGSKRSVDSNSIESNEVGPADKLYTVKELMDLIPDGLGYIDGDYELIFPSNSLVPRSQEKPPVDNGPKTYRAVEIKSYEQLLKTLGVSASAAIQGYGASVSASGSYADKESFESSSFTYLVRVTATRQPIPNHGYRFNGDSNVTDMAWQYYGNRFIKRFVTGGAFYARVSVMSTSKGNENEVIAAAKASMAGWGITADAGFDFKKSMKTLATSSTIRIDKMSVGRLRTNPQMVNGTGEEGLQLLQSLKAEADDFYYQADKHDARVYAELGDYPTTEGFSRQSVFKPLNYDTASDAAHVVLARFLELQGMDKDLQEAEPFDFDGGASTKENLQTLLLETRRKIYNWIQNVAAAPDTFSPLPSIDKFREAYLSKGNKSNLVPNTNPCLKFDHC